MPVYKFNYENNRYISHQQIIQALPYGGSVYWEENPDGTLNFLVIEAPNFTVAQRKAKELAANYRELN